MTERPLFLYKAFICHCGADEALATWLARSLQRYKVGPSLVGRDTHAGKIPARLGPIFSRSAEAGLRPLPADNVHALFGAQFLIVIASQACTKDEQVSKEIRMFKYYHGENRILYLAVGNDDTARFPAAALCHVDADGALTDRQTHPGQIIDWTTRDGLMIARIVAYLLGVSLDEVCVAQEQARRGVLLKGALFGAALLFLIVPYRGVLDRFHATSSPVPQVETSPVGAPATAGIGTNLVEAKQPLLYDKVPILASAWQTLRKWPPIPPFFGGGTIVATKDDCVKICRPWLDRIRPRPSTRAWSYGPDPRRRTRAE